MKNLFIFLVVGVIITACSPKEKLFCKVEGTPLEKEYEGISEEQAIFQIEKEIANKGITEHGQSYCWEVQPDIIRKKAQ